MKDSPPSTEELLASLNKELPYSEEAEKGVLSCWLQVPVRCEEGPDPATFYHDAHRIMATAIMTLHATKKVDPVTLTHKLRDENLLDKVGGAAAISELFAFIPMTAHFPYYSEIMREKFNLRQMIGALAAGIAHLQEFTGEGEAKAQDALDQVRTLVCEAVNDDGSPELEFTPISDLVHQVIEDAESNCQTGRKIPGLSTGIDEVDAIMGGLESGGLTVVAAESSDGKSSLCRQFLESIASEGHAVVDYTYEMQPKTEVRRILCSQGRIDSRNLKMGLLSRAEQESLGIFSLRVMKWDLAVIDVAGKTIEQICRDIARRAKKLKPGKRLVAMIDYIQLCKTSAKTQGREREVAHITATAKQCAKLTGAHIVMPSQQNSEGNVRESMAIEQDADNLIQIVKDIPKKQQGAPAWKQDKPEEPNMNRNLFFKKVRDGERYRKVPVRLVGNHFRFEVLRQSEDAK